MGKFCPVPPQRSEPYDWGGLSEDERLSLRRALRNVDPKCQRLYQCIQATAKEIIDDSKPEKAPSILPTVCHCADRVSDGSGSFWDLLKPRHYTEPELEYFAEKIYGELEEDARERIRGTGRCRVCAKKKSPEYCIVRVIASSSEDSGSAPCDCDSCVSLTCSERRIAEGECKPRGKPIPFRHCGDIWHVPSCRLDIPVEPYKANYVGKSDEIGKWGQFFDLVDRVLRESDYRLISLKLQDCADACTIMPRRRDDFDNVRRFEDIENYGFSTFCRGIMRWSNVVTKRWKCITSHPHAVIHLPSMSFPCSIRCKARRNFEALQNVQIGRIGWLVNEHSRVIYICPNKSNSQTKCILEHFVANARPDVSLSRLWVIENDGECLNKDVEQKYRSGCESLFYTPNIYRRVRQLTATCHGFIIPGVLSKTDVLIACELRVAILGPCLQFQERLLNKHYVLSFLDESRVPHPAFIAVGNFDELCEKMFDVVRATEKRRAKWLVKVNCGFCGNQSALICFNESDILQSKVKTLEYMADLLMRKLKMNKEAYKDVVDFFVELERHGGVVTECPEDHYQSVSLGCFIENDMAKSRLLTSADVLQCHKECCWMDQGYVIPQTTLSQEMLEEVASRVGEAMVAEQYIGFFGVDVVVFEEDEERKYWVVDIDPYYTDLLSFDDWRKFCLNIQSFGNFSVSSTPSQFFNKCDKEPQKDALDSDERFVVCSGKLYINGFLFTSVNFFYDLFKRHCIQYNCKVRSGCMIYPLDKEKRYFLLFSIYKSRDFALSNFVKALEALYCEASKIDGCDNRKTNVLNVAQYIMERVYGQT